MLKKQLMARSLIVVFLVGMALFGAIAFIPLAVGLDAMRQLAFADAAYPVGTPPPEVEIAILVAMTGVFLALARWALAVIERRARVAGSLSIRWQ